jgi:hypothetical protein
MQIQKHPQLKKKQDNLDALKSELSKLISDRDILEHTVKKNLEALYITRIGKNEYELFCLECQAARLKRKIELIQARLNHAEEVNLTAVEKQLDKEYKDWHEKMDKMVSDIEAGKARLNTLMPEKESKELQKIYRFLVKKLHPDINPKQTEKDKLLWNRTQDAYRIADLEELRVIKLLLEDSIDITPEENIISAINRQIKSVKEKILNIMEYINKIKSEFPFTIEDRIEDKSWVAGKNAEIFKKIEDHKLKIKELKSVIDKLLLSNIKGANTDTIK